LIKSRYPDAVIPALTPDLSERLMRIERELTRPSVMVGSSLGGLTALIYSNRHPYMVKAMVLMAPAVGRVIEELYDDSALEAYGSLAVPPGIPATIVAGARDEVIPLDDVKALYERSPDKDLLRLIIKDDDHSLHNCLELMMDLIEGYLKASP
jgi:pimeloyl-ACP methyl ester carboxylesterase